MVSTRNKTLIKNELIRFISSLGIKVNTVTKARGNRGFFKEGRIDVSKTLDDGNMIKVLVHEFAHYVNYNLDNKLKNLKLLFGEDNELLRLELLEVTKYIDENAHCHKLNNEREKLKLRIKELSESIKQTYPKFSLCEDFKEFKKYSKHSDLRYLEKYDKVRVKSWFTTKIYSIINIKKDFPDIPDVFVDYILLKSKQRTRAKISRKITRLNKYYSEPCELFARFIEGLYLDKAKVKEIAPYAYQLFVDLYDKNYYVGLRELFAILDVLIS